MQENIQTTQIEDSRHPKLFDSFFDKELDYKNDFVVYIDVTSNDNYSTQYNLQFYRDELNKVDKQLKSLDYKLFSALVENLDTAVLHDEINILSDKQYFLSELYYHLYSKKGVLVPKTATT